MRPAPYYLSLRFELKSIIPYSPCSGFAAFHAEAERRLVRSAPLRCSLQCARRTSHRDAATTETTNIRALRNRAQRRAPFSLPCRGEISENANG